MQKFQSPKAPNLLLLLDIHNANLAADPNNITSDQYYDYVHQVVERYDGDGIDDMPGLTRPVVYFEIGNEVDSPLYNHGLTLENYVLKRLIPAYLAAKDANPDAIVLNAGLALGGGESFDTSYLANMLNLIQTNSGEQHNYYLDKLAIHYYYDPQNPEFFQANFNQIKSLMAAHGLAATPVWITEYGIATKNDAGGQIREEDQASVLVRESALMDAAGIERAFVYNLKDLNSSDPSGWENVFGLYQVTCESGNETPTAKKAVKALEVFREKTRGLNFLSLNPVSERNSGIYRLTYGFGDRKVEILWYTAMDRTGINPDHVSESTTVTADIGLNAGLLTDMEGNILDDQLADETVITIGEQPKYIEIYNDTQDRDGDNILDSWELAHGLDPDDPDDALLDPDHDGLSNLDEYLQGTDPHNADSDGDGMADCWEVVHYLDPTVDDASGDLDGDGLSNVAEYSLRTDPGNADTDGDGINDRDEYDYGIDPTVVQTVAVSLDREAFQVSVAGSMELFIRLASDYNFQKNVDIALAGLPIDWYELSAENQQVNLAPFGRRTISVPITIPADCQLAGTYPFEVVIQWDDNGNSVERRVAGELQVSAAPVVTPLKMPVDPQLASNSIVASWRTDITADSYFYYRAYGEESFTELTVGSQTKQHSVVVENLPYFTDYECYALTRSACGDETVTPKYHVRTGKAVAFVERRLDAVIDRTYNQQFTFHLLNQDMIDHDYRVAVVSAPAELQVGFVGETAGMLAAGGSQPLTLAVNAPDAARDQYELLLQVTSDPDDTFTFVDVIPVSLQLRPAVWNLAIEQVDYRPDELTAQFRITNFGDPIDDVAVLIETDNGTIPLADPLIQHQRLETGEEVTFNVYVEEYTTGTITVQGGGNETSIGFEIGCSPGNDLITHTFTDVAIIAEVADWYCTNRMHLEVPFMVLRGFTHDELDEAALEVTFELPMDHSLYTDHDVSIRINGREVGSFSNTVPEGTYIYRFPTSYINLGVDAPAENQIELVADGISAGEYLVATSFKVILNVSAIDVVLCQPPPPDYHRFPPKLVLPDPETTIIDDPEPIDDDVMPVARGELRGVSKRKYRPGETAHIKVSLANNDSLDHHGVLTLYLQSDACDAPAEFALPAVAVSVPSGETYTHVFTYKIPPETPDVNYSCRVRFENQTLGTVQERQGGFIVRKPVIIIHGILGSTMVEHFLNGSEKTVYDPQEQLWLPCDDPLARLVVDTPGGKVINSAVAPKKLIKDFTISIPFIGPVYRKDLFAGLERYLAKEGYQLSDASSVFSTRPDDDVFYFVYDWRRDIDDLADELDTFMENIRTLTGYDQVNLVAHSMGGLVVKSLFNQHTESSQFVDNVVFLGTPNLGALDGLSKMIHGLSMNKILSDTTLDYFQINLNDDYLEAVKNTRLLYKIASMPIATKDLILTGLDKTLGAAEDFLIADHCSDSLKLTKVGVSFLADLVALDLSGALLDLVGTAAEFYRLDKDLDLLNDEQVKSLMHYFPSAYSLLPSSLYATYYSGFYSRKGVTSQDSWALLDDYIHSLDGEAVQLQSNAAGLHQRLDSMTLPGKSYLVFGCGKRTPVSLHEVLMQNGDVYQLNYGIASGDGTVPLKSAYEMNVARKFAAVNVDHLALPSQMGVRNLIRGVLHGDETVCGTLPEGQNVIECARPDCTACGLPDGAWIIITPPGDGGGFTAIPPDLWPKIWDPDQAGNHGFTGYTGNTIYVGIEGSDYRITDNGIEIFVPTGKTYEVEMGGYDTLPYKVKLQYMENGVPGRTYFYQHFVVPEGGKVVIDANLVEPGMPPSIKKDADGDGTFEEQDIAPDLSTDGSHADDTICPTTSCTITGNLLNGDDCYQPGLQVVLQAEDEGSGVSSIWYQIDGQGDFVAYADPIHFTETGVHSLAFYAVDQALNIEAQQIMYFKIDDGPPQWTHTMVWDNPSAGLARNSTIGFELSEDIDAASVNSQSIVVTGEINGQYPGTVSYDPQTRVVLFTPDDKYYYQDVLTITLRGDVADIVGLTLDGNENNLSEGSPQDDVVVENVAVSKSDGLQVSIADIDSTGCPLLSARVMVTGSDGSPITDLVKNNFSLLDDYQFIEIQNVAFVEQEDATISVSLAMDYSGSMGSAGIADMESAADTFIQYLESGDQAEIVKFAQGVEVVQAFTSDQTLLHDAVFLQPDISSSSTSLYDAVVQAVNDTALVPVGQKAVIVLTDGNDNSSSATFDEALTAAQTTGIPVFAIGLGGGVNTDLLTQLAQQSGGMYFAAPTSDDLQEIYDSIAFVLQNQYVIEYSSPALDGGDHQLQVVAEQNNLGGSDRVVYQVCGCRIDIDNDLDVDGKDLQILQQAYGFADPDPDYDARCDFNQDGVVDMADVEIFLGKYGTCCY